MRRVIKSALSVAIFAVGGPLSAQERGEDVVVRAFDGPDVSTVEIPLGSTPFRIERAAPRTLDISTPGSFTNYDLRQITLSGLARRVLTARQVRDTAGARLRLSLDCDCSDSALISNGVLQIEFREQANSDTPRTLAQPRRAAPGGTINAPRFSPQPLKRLIPAADAARTRTVEIDDADAEASRVAAGGPGVDEGAVDKAAEVRLARQKLLEQLSRAADQGLLDLADGQTELDAPVASASTPPLPEEKIIGDDPVALAEIEEEAVKPGDEEASRATASDPVKPEPVKRNVELPLRARTAIDRSFRRDRRDTVAVIEACPEDWRFDLTPRFDSHADASFNDAVTKHVGVLLDEFDEPRAEPVNRLIRLYILNGFGAEARQLIAMFREVVESADILTDLAYVIEGAPPLPDGPLATSARCSGKTAMWFDAAALQADTPGVSSDRLLEAIAGSPKELRLLLGPRIMSHRLQLGDVETAKRVDDLLSRIPGDVGPSFDIARAKLLAFDGRDAASEALLVRLARSAEEESRAALLLLLDGRLARGDPIGPEFIAALSEAALLSRGGAMERALKTAEIRALAASGGVGFALDEVAKELAYGNVDPVVLRDAALRVLENVEGASRTDDRFVEDVLRNADLIPLDASGDAARSAVATAFSGLGLPNLAMDMLSPRLDSSDLGDAPVDIRLAAAKARLALNQPSEALDLLDGLTTSPAGELRIEALVQLGRYSEALASASASNTIDDAAENLAFLAEDWSNAARSQGTQSPMRLLAAAMAADGQDPQRGEDLSDLQSNALTSLTVLPEIPQTPSLSDVDRAIDGATTLRNTINEALNNG